MLYARINKEYINQDELAKKIVFERTISQVNKLYKDQPEVAMKPGQLSSQLKYGFDSLFEGFRSAIEQVLSAEYNGDITTQKTYEIIKKYNQLSSYLKNVVNMKQLSPEDEETIKKSFNELKDKLELLKQIAIDNNFLDKEDIIEMVDKINETSTQPKQELEKVSGKTTGMTQAIQDKNASVKLINDAIDKLNVIEQDLQDQNIANSTKVPSQEAEYKTLFGFFHDQNLNPLEFSLIQQNYDAVDNLEKDVKNDITWFVDTKKLLINTYDELSDYDAKNDFPNVDNALIDKMVQEKIAEPKADELKILQDRFDALTDIEQAEFVNIAKLQQDTDDAENRWDQIAIDAKAELAKYKVTFFTKFKADLQNTSTYNGNNDMLDENKLLIEEKTLNDLLSRITTEEEIYLTKIMKDVDDEIKKISVLVIKVSTQPQLPKKKIKTTKAPQALASKSVSNPIYTTYSQFENAYKDALKMKKAKTKVFTVFVGKPIKDPTALGQAIRNKWKVYTSLDEGKKKLFFT
jgi:hypothetical protein